MKLVKQPEGSSCCGQACVAMLAGIDLDIAIMVFRTKGRTRYKALIQALRQLGVESAEKWNMGFPKSGDAILRYSDGQKSHWVVWWGGKYYDPAAGVFKWEPTWLKDATVTSHLRVGPVES